MVPFKPFRKGKIRFVVIFLAAMLMFGNQYAFNNPQALEESLEEHLHITETQFNLFYTIFAFPNIFTTLIIGVLIDFLGVRIGIVSLSLGVAFAQTIVAFGGQFESYHTMLWGRMIFGIFSESLVTAQASIIAIWFRGGQLAAALGIILTFPEIGNALNSLLTPVVYDRTHELGPPLFLSVGFCFLSVGCGLVLCYIDIVADRDDKKHEAQVKEYNEKRGIHHAEGGGQHIKCDDLKQLPGTFWVILVLCMFGISLYVGFMDNANRLFQKRFCFSQVQAGQAVMMTYLVCAFASPGLGILVDKFGKRRYFIVMTTLVFFTAHFLLLVYPSCNGEVEIGAVTGLVLIGFGFALYANCMVPVIPLIVRESIIGTAFGLMAMIESIALSIFPLVAAKLVHSNEDPQIGYRYSSLFFTTMASLGVVTSLSLFLIDRKLKKVLDSPKPLQVTDQDAMYSTQSSPKKERANSSGLEERFSTPRVRSEAGDRDSQNELEIGLLNKGKYELDL